MSFLYNLLLNLTQRGSSWKLLASVINTHTKELLTALYLGFLTLIFLSYLVYQIEHDEGHDGPQMFDSFADALWWAIITLTTVGYGDRYPKSWIGRLLNLAINI